MTEGPRVQMENTPVSSGSANSRVKGDELFDLEPCGKGLANSKG